MFKINRLAICLLYAFSCTISHASDLITAIDLVVKSAIQHDTSLPLRYLHAKENTLLHRYTNSTLQPIREEVHPLDIQASSLLIPLKGYQGLGMGFGDYQVNTERPDPASSVGLIHFVQAVNSELAVFYKSTMELVTGFPKPLNDLWAGFGGACETQNTGGATVKYDQLARRWVISQYAYDDARNGPFYQCIAVSTTEDATGRYHRYAFQFDSYNENTRIGLWPNAYYLGAYSKGPVITGPLMCALQRFRMLSGLPATMQCKIGSPQSPFVQPIDLDGRLLPSTPGFFASLNPPNNIVLHRFKVDFNNPANTIVTDFMIPVATFQEACSLTQGIACAIQPNTVNRLNVYSDRVMSRFVYREFNDYGAMVLTHTIEGPLPKRAPAIRWYEMRVQANDPNATPVIYQQATIAPDSKNRFIGGITIDRFGNIAIGYTVTSSLIFPSLELAMHNFPDPRNTMTIQPLATGRGSQIDDIHDWGNQSSISVDPIDECTFWQTGEYLKTTGSFNWSTFILKFKLVACT